MEGRQGDEGNHLTGQAPGGEGEREKGRTSKAYAVGTENHIRAKKLPPVPLSSVRREQ